MKYIISERQLEVVEIGTHRGRWENNPEEGLWFFFDKELKKKQKIDSFKEYFSKTFNVKKKTYSDKQILSYFYYLSTSFDQYEDIDPYLKEENTSLGFAYYIAKNYFDLKKGLDISFIKVKESFDYKNYYFFDSVMKHFVGTITTSRAGDFLPKGSRRVNSASIVKPLIGVGYGTKMYMSVIDDVEYLQSDRTLFTGSLRMWRDVLPKYVNVWAVVDAQFIYMFKKQTPGKRYHTSLLECYVASSKHEEIPN